MAETLCEEMLRAAGNTVYKFGYESVLQNLTQIESKFDSRAEIGERIRAIPDLIVIDTMGIPSFVEVKFRWDPTAQLHDNTIDILERVEKYWDATMIFVNAVEKPYFRVSRPPYFKTFSQPKRGLVFTPLVEELPWNISPDLYAEYEQLVEKYITSTAQK